MDSHEEYIAMVETVIGDLWACTALAIRLGVEAKVHAPELNKAREVMNRSMALAITGQELANADMTWDDVVQHMDGD